MEYYRVYKQILNNVSRILVYNSQHSKESFATQDAAIEYLIIKAKKNQGRIDFSYPQDNRQERINTTETSPVTELVIGLLNEEVIQFHQKLTERLEEEAVKLLKLRVSKFTEQQTAQL